MSVYYNEFDPFAAAWLRELMADGVIPKGVVDERSIANVQPDDVRGYRQCHFFAGIGGWAEALRLAGWGDRPVWTGSCPCQPFSTAGKRKGERDDRHLWPAWFRLIRECQPPVVIGEQVASGDALRWLDGVFDDLEGTGYACGAADLCAAGVGAPHIRQRLFWVANNQRVRFSRWRDSAIEGTPPVSVPTEASCVDGWLGDAASRGRGISGHEAQPGSGGHAVGAGGSGRGFWSEYDVIHCRDGKFRRIPRQAQPSFQPVADGLPAGVDGVRIACEGRFPLAGKIPNRTGLLRGAGNAIVPQVAAEFVKAFMETQL